MQLKRSIVNKSIDNAITVIEHFGIKLPPFASWTPDQWQSAGDEYNEIRHCMLGWDVTDFGSEDFFNIGRVLFTLRNGRKSHGGYAKEYAEKLLIDPENQRAPAHFHRTKREDLICRAGGNILAQVTMADSKEKRSAEAFTVQVDGCRVNVQAGSIIRLAPGQSLCIPPGTIHQFWAEEGTGWMLDGVGYTVSSEVSSVCDDHNDNVFIDVTGVRFPVIVEDEPKRYLLCNEYPEV